VSSEFGGEVGFGSIRAEEVTEAKGEGSKLAHVCPQLRG